MMTQIPEVILCGLLIGLVYSLAATGLSIIWGVMGIINFAHGEFLMLGMFGAFWLNCLVSLDPVFSMPLVALGVGILSIIIYQFILKRIVGASLLVTLLCTFGLAIAIRGIVQFFWGPNYRMIPYSFFRGTFSVGNLYISVPKLVAGLISGAVAIAVYCMLKKSRQGRAIQAISMDKEAAMLKGINVDWLYALTFAIGGICAGVAGALISNFYPISPHAGAVFVLIAFTCVALGGFGSIEGAFLAGIIIGVAQALGGYLIAPAFEYAIIYLTYIVIVLIQPKGLFKGW
jgi:branched-chain amino acid transport system permease protein